MSKLTKVHKKLYRQYMLGKLNVEQAARRMGYKGEAMRKGVQHVSTVLADMGIIIV